jgi:hypothetical protein
MNRPYPFDEFPPKGSDWRAVEDTYDAILVWLGYWRTKMPAEAVEKLQDILNIPKN